MSNGTPHTACPAGSPPALCTCGTSPLAVLGTAWFPGAWHHTTWHSHQGSIAKRAGKQQPDPWGGLRVASTPPLCGGPCCGESQHSHPGGSRTGWSTLCLLVTHPRFPLPPRLCCVLRAPLPPAPPRQPRAPCTMGACRALRTDSMHHWGLQSSPSPAQPLFQLCHWGFAGPPCSTGTR